MELTTWNPFNEMEAFFDRYNRNRPATSRDVWAPTVNISETEKEYLITAELAGIDSKDVEITVQNNVLTLRGERHDTKESKDTKRHLIETSFGRFSRSFSLPSDVIEERISAKGKDGMLTIHVPKAEIAPAKKITVKAE
ncbi:MULTISPECIES: Hsp20/alpha crystallin family protein [Salinicola]|jgi:HSP20 family protein|uniref:Hsp20/alpha crystallin family protein n=1 Tax=Salinicola TaxID=404432 RepID=UPI000B40386B|nr:Hsp20/alpha crystallin family protein [Salinicola salarius]